MLHHVRGVRLQHPDQPRVLQPNLCIERERDKPEVVNHLHQVFQDLATHNEEEDVLYDERYHVLIREYNHLPQPVQPQQPGRNVQTIHERKEVHSFISHVPWEANIPQMTVKIYQEQQDRHFVASRRMLTEGIIQKNPCQLSDEDIRRYLNHTVTSAIAFEWPVHIQHSWQIPNQPRWLMIQNPIEHYFRGLYPHSHAILPTTTNYGYLHKVVFHSHLSNPINQFLFEHYGPSPEQPDTIERRNLMTFVTQQKPIWIFTRYHTLPNAAGIGISQPNAFVRLDRSYLWKEDTIEDRLEQLCQKSDSSEEGFDWEAHSPRHA